MENKLDKNATSNIKHVLGTAPHEAAAVPPPTTITKTINIIRSRHMGHCWTNRDELISDILLWSPSHWRAKAGRPAWTYIQQVCTDTRCSPEDLLEQWTMGRGLENRVRDIRTDRATWWWWWGRWWNVMNGAMMSKTCLFSMFIVFIRNVNPTEVWYEFYLCFGGEYFSNKKCEAEWSLIWILSLFWWWVFFW